MFFCCAQSEDKGREVVTDDDVAHDASADRPVLVAPLAGADRAPPVDPAPQPVAVPIEEAATGLADEPAPAAAEPAPTAEEPAPAPEKQGALVIEGTPTHSEATKNVDVEEFQIECTKKTDDDVLGIDILPDKKVFVITGFKDGGLVDRWNSANPSKQVKYGAGIYEINGVGNGMVPMMKEAAKSVTLVLKVRRHSRYTITVQKKRILGLDLKTGTLCVSRVTQPSSTLSAEDISLHGWNAKCPHGLEILAGDTIVEVNGKQGTPQELLQAIKKSAGELSLTFARA